MSIEQIQALKALYANVEKQAHTLRGNPLEYSVITGLCPVNVIEMQAQKIQALLTESDADKALIAEQAKRIAELEAMTVSLKLPPRAPENLASVLDGYEKWLVATTFRDTWNACLAEVTRVNAAGITLVVEE